MKNIEDYQRSIKLALVPVNKLHNKYPGKVPAASELSEETICWINAQIEKIWENLKNTDLKSLYREFNSGRNLVAHNKEEFTPAELSAFWNPIFSKLCLLKSDLEKRIQFETNPIKRRFRKYGTDRCGSEADRQQLLDALDDACNNAIPNDDKIEFPENELSKNVQQILTETISDEESAKYITEHPGLNNNIQNDILEWLKTVDKKISQENPFDVELQFIGSLKEKTPSDINQMYSEIQIKFESISDSNIDFEFYRKEFEKIETTSHDADSRKIKEAAVSESLIEDLMADCLERRNNWVLRQIDELRDKFIKELLEKLANFKKLEKSFSALCEDTGFLWDLSKGFFRDSGFDILNTYADLLEKDESLKNFAEILGKHTRTQKEYEKELREKTVIYTEYHPRPAYKGQITGIRTSNDISSVLPTELALLKNPATKKLFELKYAQKQLLSFKYVNPVPEQKTKTEREEISIEKEKTEQNGPIIICVDTSGSMHGTPESVAKTITFALTRIAIKEKRKCYLISFSTGIETLDLSYFSADGKNQLDTLISFLRMSFNGGTDASPALRHALEMLEKEDYKNADVLMISDFVMGSLRPDIVSRIEAEKKKNTDFYSLVIGNTSNQNVIECFNHNWSYNMNDSQSGKRLVEQLAGFGHSQTKW